MIGNLNLDFKLKFEDLYSSKGIEKIDAAFVAELKDTNVDLHNRFVMARLQCHPEHSEGSQEILHSAQNDKLNSKDESNLLIELAPYLEDFIGRLFGITEEVRALNRRHGELFDIYVIKRNFVQRRAERICKPEDAQKLDGEDLLKELKQVMSDVCCVISEETQHTSLNTHYFEQRFAQNVMKWIDDKGVDIPGHEEKVILAGKYASWALNSEEGRKKHKVGVLFKKPRKLDFQHLIAVETEVIDGMTVIKLPKNHLRHREGFALTDKGGSLAQAMDEANYCIWCHNQGKDSCSKGLVEKLSTVLSQPSSENTKDDGRKTEDIKKYKKTPLNVPQAGCPLEEKISEMNSLKAQGYSLGALAVVAVDNPLCAATGHRICNDCMKSCIYQKQEPVNIPMTETRTLQDVLDLPWGFEIYSLLSRWNPLNLRRPVPRKETGYKVLIAGLGPAGFNLAHHLMNDGHTVVAVDGLKIEPLPSEISGVTPLGERVPFKPVKWIDRPSSVHRPPSTKITEDDGRTSIDGLFDNLDERINYGFGGVAEYGITVRWNKNYLKIIRLLLERRSNFAMYGGVRFGSTITYDSAWKLGFDHVALCLGAGKPTIVSMPNALARGVRTASDFLMALQLTGAGKKDSIANLQVRMPVVVIGGGLTAVDAATEALAYYPVQVEKFLHRYETLIHERGEGAVQDNWTAEENEIAEEFIFHAQAIREERRNAAKENREPDIIGLLKKWGGAKIAYRKNLADAPSYRLNHEEVEKALEEGIEFVENVTPASVELDKYGHAEALRVSFHYTTPDGKLEETTKLLPAKTIFMAAGTSPNTVLQREDPLHFQLDGKYFAAIDENGNKVTPEANTSKPNAVHVLMSKEVLSDECLVMSDKKEKNTQHTSLNTHHSKYVSYFGDLHPSYVGNVVKAMGSAKQGYPIVTRVLSQAKPLTDKTSAAFIKEMNKQLIARVHEVIRLTPNIVEVIIKAPLAAAEFNPGQFYRLQNFESLALRASDECLVMNDKKEKNTQHTSHNTHHTTLTMEGLALTGAWVDKKKGLLSTIALEMGGSSDLCIHLKKDEPVILMGPTGTPTETPSGETVMLVGGGLGNAVLFSIGKAFREKGSKVLYFAGYKKLQDRYKVEEIEKAADLIVWCCDEGKFEPSRPQDKSFHGNIVQAMLAYAKGELGGIPPIWLKDVNRIITIGSDRMMAAVGQSRHSVLKPYLKPEHEAIASINSPMQCMMKEICAQCLQRHRDPKTGDRYYVYSCFNQDQCLDKVDFPHLNERLKQNTVQEKLTALWIDRSLKLLNLR